MKSMRPYLFRFSATKYCLILAIATSTILLVTTTKSEPLNQSLGGEVFYLSSFTTAGGEEFTVPRFIKQVSKLYDMKASLASMAEEGSIQRISLTASLLCNLLTCEGNITDSGLLSDFECDQTLNGCALGGIWGRIPYFYNWIHALETKYPRSLEEMNTVIFTKDSLVFSHPELGTEAQFILE